MVTENLEYIDIAKKALKNIIPGMYQSVVAFAHWSNLLQVIHHGAYVMAVTGPAAQKTAKELHSKHLPNVVVVFSNKPSDIPVLLHHHSEEKTRIFVCTENSCLEPVEEVEGALQKVKRPEN
jgi:uncharacterized protein YyaL (SSP411 family)